MRHPRQRRSVAACYHVRESAVPAPRFRPGHYSTGKTDTQYLGREMFGVGTSTDAVLAFAQLGDTAALYIPMEEIRAPSTRTICVARRLEVGDYASGSRLAGLQ